MAYALFQFAGRTSRRALIVLSDGSDVGSDFPIEQVVDFALRAGVAVYTISLGRFEDDTSGGLRRVAVGTGGRAFQAASAAQLPAVYREREAELRAQYLLVYRPGAAAALERPRVEVEVLLEGYRAREIRRYY